MTIERIANNGYPWAKEKRGIVTDSHLIATSKLDFPEHQERLNYLPEKEKHRILLICEETIKSGNLRRLEEWMIEHKDRIDK